MMIMPAGGDVAGAVKLLDKDHAHKLMGEGHLGKGKTEVAHSLDAFGQTVGASDNEGDISLSLNGTLLDKRGKLLA